MTPTQKALSIISLNDGERLTATEFARKMWPDSKSWRRLYGHGACRAGGAFLARLERNGLVYRLVRHLPILTRAGKAELAKAKETAHEA